MTDNRDWDRLLNPFRYSEDGNLTPAALQQDAGMRLSAPDAGPAHTPNGQSEVDTAVLSKCANILVELRSSTDNVDKVPVEKSDAAGGGLKGWETADGLIAMGVRWSDQARQLNGLLQKISDNLYRTTGSYTDTEEAEKVRINAIGNGGHY